MYDVPALASYLGTTDRHIRKLIQDRRVPYVKVGRLVRFREDEIERWLAENHWPVRSELHEPRNSSTSTSGVVEQDMPAATRTALMINPQ